MNAKTIHSEQVWQSSDGQRTIWEVTLKADDGKEYRLKTYSAKIAQMGYEGEVRSYVNPRGERFVRQVPTNTKPSFSRDDSAIRAQWAIGQAINLASVKMEKEAITLPVIEKYAKELFATVSRVKGEPMTPEMENKAESYIRGFTQAPSLF
jgi:hypothetical protein